ncbi:MAG: glycoside hydrolase/phage tail family protein [Methylobacteriaceae bacterium]|nr:glycoside hydrolase/phage tail family protein [Methylobacteriaceae bacterium]
MSTLLLQVAGSAVGALIGGPVGALAGQALGALAGAAIDNRLFAPSGGARHVEGPRLAELAGISSSEGAPIPRVYGRARVGGQVIWATRFEEVVATTRQGGGGGKGAPKKPSVTTTTYTYFANVAIGLCEGPIAGVRRVWADGKELDQNAVVMRVHRGFETQQPDPLILAKEGGVAPAYRGLAYVVFERLPLESYGNRLPQLSFEVVRPIAELAERLRGVALIPGASEFAYAQAMVSAEPEPGVSRAENRHQLERAVDFVASLDALQTLCPSLSSIALVVAWFGDDLRAGQCTIAPRVELSLKTTSGEIWSVAGLTRDSAREVSRVGGAPAYGGTPSDASVLAAIAALKARGLSVVFYPFVMMDVAAGNALPDPWTGAATQPAYPWRGRITCDPAPGRPGTVDASPAAAAQLAAFFGSPAPPDSEWSLRRMALHYANLCVAAGGVDAFLVGSELVGLTRVRSAPGVYPAAQALAQLAADVKSILGATTRVSYAADWTEYGAHVIGGGAEIRFPLDVVWSSPSVDFVGVDAYWPLTDWRDGRDHLDAEEAASIYDRAFLSRRVSSGPDFDWYYASPADRAAQLRTPISDGAYGKPWIYRSKDLVGWWSNAHVERVGGVETTATNWTAMSKPIWLVEIGCPAVDRGANQPNVFPDPKSSESAAPHFSRDTRDDLMLIAANEALLAHFDPAHPLFVAADNPVSPIYGGRMVDPARIHCWAWDARPFPAFPLQSGAWSDAANWMKGHWLTGRLESAPLDALIAAMLADAGAPASLIGAIDVDGHLDGYVIERPMSPRAAIEALTQLFGFDARCREGRIVFSGRDRARLTALADDELIQPRDGAALELTRAQESELPREASLTFTEGEVDYRRLTVASRRIEGASSRQTRNDVAAVLQTGEAQRRLDALLYDIWTSRERASFRLPPSRLALEPGDLVTLPATGAMVWRIERIVDSGARRIEARAADPDLFDLPRGAERLVTQDAPPIAGRARVETLDLAVDRDGAGVLTHVAVFADPWPGPMAIWRDVGGAFETQRLVARSAILGATLDPLPPGPVGRIDRATSLRVRVLGGALSSVSEAAMLQGANLMAARGADGAWEIFAFAQAELVAPQTWRLSGLLRGLGGEEHLAARHLDAGATVVRLDEAVTPLATGLSALGASTRWRIGAARLDSADPSVVEIVATPSAKALMPYAPVRASARRVAAGVEIGFIRRGRIDSDGWAALDIPLGEAGESYEIDVLAGPLVKRTLVGASPTIVYADADELADFGAAQTALSLRIRQMSATVGRGFALAATIPVL